MKDRTQFQAIFVDKIEKLTLNILNCRFLMSLLAKKAHLEIMQEQEKERQKAVSQKIIKKDTGRSF